MLELLAFLPRAGALLTLSHFRPAPWNPSAEASQPSLLENHLRTKTGKTVYGNAALYSQTLNVLPYTEEMVMRCQDKRRSVSENARENVINESLSRRWVT